MNLVFNKNLREVLGDLAKVDAGNYSCVQFVSIGLG